MSEHRWQKESEVELVIHETHTARCEYFNFPAKTRRLKIVDETHTARCESFKNIAVGLSLAIESSHGLRRWVSNSLAFEAPHSLRWWFRE